MLSRIGCECLAFNIDTFILNLKSCFQFFIIDIYSIMKKCAENPKGKCLNTYTL